MTFSEQLNKYIKQIECSSKDLVIASGSNYLLLLVVIAEEIERQV